MPRPARIALRSATSSDVPVVHRLIDTHVAEGHLLPRSLDDVERHVERFVVAVRGRSVVGCGELAPLSTTVAEIRSLVVSASARRHGLGRRLVDELRTRAQHDGFDRLCVFTHSPGYFAPMGFSIVPHLWIPEKVFTDCVACPRFRQCGQFAMVQPLDAVSDSLEHGVRLVARHV